MVSSTEIVSLGAATGLRHQEQQEHHVRTGKTVNKNHRFMNRSRPDPPENCHLTVKKLPKTCHKNKIAQNFTFFFKKIANGNLFEKNENFWQLKKKKSSFWQFF